MKTAAVLVVLAVAACATASTSHWERDGASSADFQADNERCGAVSSRMAPTPRPDQPAAGNVAPKNRMDAPPRIDANPARHRAFMDCMAEHGWRVIDR